MQCKEAVIDVGREGKNVILRIKKGDVIMDICLRPYEALDISHSLHIKARGG